MAENSIFLAKIIGLISVISTGAMLLNYKKSIAFEREASKNPLFIYVSGFIFLILGVLLVVSHSVWVPDWRIVITLLGCIILGKGIGRMLFPETVAKLIGKKQSNTWFIIGEIMVFFVGLYLLYYGFIIY